MPQPTRTGAEPNGLISPWALLQRLAQHPNLNKTAAERLAGWSGAYMQPADRHTPVDLPKAEAQVARVISLVLATLNEARKDVIVSTQGLLRHVASGL